MTHREGSFSFRGRHLTTPRKYARQQEEQEEVGNYMMPSYLRKIILPGIMFEMGVTAMCDAFCV